MKKKKDIIRIIVWSVLGLLVGLFCLQQVLVLLTPISRPIPKERANLRNILHTLELYQHDYNYLPYYPENPDRALYLLKEMSHISWFDYPYEDRYNPFGVVYWDDNNKEIENSFYEYINKLDLQIHTSRGVASPLSKEEDKFDELIIIAEKDVGRKKRRFITQSGYTGYTKPYYKGIIVGKRYKEIK